MREIFWIDGWVDGRFRRGDVYTSTRGGVVKHSKEGKVAPGVSDRVWRKKDADISSKLGRKTARKLDYLGVCFDWFE